MSLTYFNHPRQNAGLDAPNFAISSTVNEPFQNAVKSTFFQDVRSLTGPMTGLANNPSATVRVSRVADLVTLNIVGITGATAGAGVISLQLPALPEKYRPVVQKVLPTLIMNDTTRTSGAVVVAANGDISVQTVPGTSFPGAVAGIVDTSVSWAVNSLLV